VPDAPKRVREGEPAAGKIRPGVSLKFERYRIGSAFHPNFAADHAFHAIVDLSAHDTIMNPKRHAEIMRQMDNRDNIFVAGFKRVC
jgi:hypothetical protein